MTTHLAVLNIIHLNQQYGIGLENAVDFTAAGNKSTTTPQNLWQKCWDWKHEKCDSSVWSLEINAALKTLLSYGMTKTGFLLCLLKCLCPSYLLPAWFSSTYSYCSLNGHVKLPVIHSLEKQRYFHRTTEMLSAFYKTLPKCSFPPSWRIHISRTKASNQVFRVP